MVSLDNAKLIFAAFMRSPSKPQYIRQIAANCELSYERVQHYLGELEESKVLFSKTKGKIKEYSINRKSELALKLFAILEMEKRQKFNSKNPLLHACLADLSAGLAKGIKNSVSEVRFALLFGSVARGEAKEGSDIDVLIVARNKDASFREHLKGLKEKLEAVSGRVFSLHAVEYRGFASRWRKEPVYSTIWTGYVVLMEEENFWKEVLERGEPE